MILFVYRRLTESEIPKIAEIDRSEEIEGYYVYKNGQLKLILQHESVVSFDEQELADILYRQVKIKKDGGEIIGAFNQGQLIGVVSVEKKRFGRTLNFCKMDILYVSKKFRGMKIAAQLVHEAKKTARQFGAEKLYISATATKNTIDFYMHLGAVLTSEINENLFKKEPQDIHLELPAYYSG